MNTGVMTTEEKQCETMKESKSVIMRSEENRKEKRR